MVPRCPVCLIRHADRRDCPPPGEEGRITRALLVDAFRSGWGVCLPCQCVLMNPGDRCPGCGGPWERFGDDDLEAVP